MGNCSLKINTTQADHNNEKIYVWIEPNQYKNFFFNKVVTLKITGNAPHPRLWKEGRSSGLRAGDVVRVFCEVIHTCPPPPPSVSFRNQTGQVQRSQTNDGQGRWRVTVDMNRTLSREDNGRRLVCDVSHLGGQTASGEILLSVAYAPVILLDSTCTLGYQTVSCECVVDSNPPAIVTWSPVGSATNHNHSTSSTLSGQVLWSVLTVPLGDGNLTFNCKATNEHGVAFLQFDLPGFDVQMTGPDLTSGGSRLRKGATDEFRTIQNKSANTCSTVLGQLDRKSHYWFRMVPVAGLKSGEPSKEPQAGPEGALKGHLPGQSVPGQKKQCLGQRKHTHTD
ncbi:hypothetical protein GJAV_G00002750 [Gymnothorax javanicus]|nr:hypothetical protein GJAV_G00002750 [Gymnothorax javanicus]